MDINEILHCAVRSLLADAEFALALTDCDEVRGNRHIVEHSMVTARKYYGDLLRRRGPLLLTDEEETTFLAQIEALRTRLRAYGR